jgi:hypothetical protein
MSRLRLASVALLLLPATLRAADPVKAVLPPAADRSVDFVKDVQPILAKACVGCHGPEKQKGGLRLDDRKSAFRGGNRGAVLVPGKPLDSRLLTLAAGLDAELRMPPEGRKPLSAADLGLLRAWIEQGARWPDDGGTTVVQTKSDHWSFQPIRRPTPPAVKNTASVRNDIDRFVLARLEKEGLTPSPEADRVTLIRRLSFDLLGLPPAPEEVDAFLADERPDAYERLVDRLLASPHYGERWGRHWLDLARYADSDGFEKDTGRPYAWRYRNWVIEALNRDLPYDQFTVEQLAGDLLPNATVEQKVATGFHRNTLTNKEGGVDQEQFRVEAVVDRVNTTGKVWLGLTVGCAQCHDHKYDPLSQREYYQLFGFFNSDKEVEVAAPLPGDDERYRKAKTEYDARLADARKNLDAYRMNQLPAAQAKWEKSLTAKDRESLPEPVRAALAVETEKRTPVQAKTITDHFGKSDAKLTQLTKVVADLQKNAPKLTQAQTLALGRLRRTHVMIRGDFLRPGVEVDLGTPAVLPPLPRSERPTRLDLARWLVADNPLTPRVTVNWMWSKYFGRGLVATPEDFGTQGERPSHPELLDHLATQLVDRKWSLKAMHRYIVCSATYRQASKVRPELARRDPLNVLLTRQARLRLEAENIRDAALTSSGLLTRTVGGPSVRPPQPAGISELTYANSARWIESTGADRYRRGLYIWFQRTSPYPMLLTFDAPDSNVCVVRRERSNSPLQALTLMNDTVFVECAQALARRVVSERGPAEERARRAFRLCVSREPTPTELARIVRLHDDLLVLAKAKPEAAAKLAGKTGPNEDVAELAAWVGVSRALLNLDEFVTRE